ncbi:MAG: FecR domain-containing protein [Candidatus Thiodiazotropha weberae]|nr:FecR domain-containing protein [Candidatus Thiodiazotropha weberae]MCG7914969.1 FecR domain-containing protein [Candidatus Thiodiazotropha weberae]
MVVGLVIRKKAVPNLIGMVLPFDMFFISRASILLLLLLSTLSTTVWSEDWIYKLHEGENLTLVKERFLKPEFTAWQLQVYNSIEKDREIPVGTEIRVPIDWMRDQLAGVEVSFVYGGVFILRRGDEAENEALKGDILKAGDRIKTAERSAASLRFADQSVLLIGESSEVVFDALSSYQGIGMLDTRIRLQRGRVENRITPFSRPESRYEIHTPAAVTVVRGTDFRVSSDLADDVTRSEVTEGEVRVTAQGRSVFVTQGEGTRVVSGEAPAEPRRLLPAPDMTELDLTRVDGGLLLEWPGLSDAVSYRYQLKDRDQVLVAIGISQAPYVELPLQPAGEYHLLLRGIDELGLEGMEGETLFHLHLQKVVEIKPSSAPVATTQLMPPKFFPHGIWFQWSAVADAWGYRFLFARDPGLSDLLFERLSFDTGFEMGYPGPGRYFVAVEALAENDAEKKRLSNSYVIDIPVR